MKRSQGGSDFDLSLLVALCRWCHDQTDAPYERGRLLVTTLGDGQFSFEAVTRAARERADGDFCPRGQNVQPDPLLLGMPSLHTGLPTWAKQEGRRDSSS